MAWVLVKWLKEDKVSTIPKNLGFKGKSSAYSWIPTQGEMLLEKEVQHVGHGSFGSFRLVAIAITCLYNLLVILII